MPNPRSLGSAALLLSVSVLLSRVLGYVRDAVLAWQFGATAETDAYLAAFWLPDLLNYFLAGGALSMTFIPLFSERLAAKDEDGAWRLFWRLAQLTAAVLLPTIAVAWWFTPQLVAVMYPGFDAAQVELTSRLTRIILPGPLFFALGGLLSGTELARRRFEAAALAPLAYNACIVVGGIAAAPWLGVEGFSWGVLAGAFLGPFALTAAFARRGLRRVPPLELGDPVIRRYGWMVLPLLLGVSLTTVDEWLGRWAASGMAEGSVTWLNNARRLMLVPVALLGQAAGQAALPFLTSLFAEHRLDEFQATLNRSIRVVTGLGAIAGAAMALFAPGIVGLVYGWGAYGGDDVAQTAATLAWMALAIPAWCAQGVVVRAFYAQQRMWAPMLATTVTALAVIPLYAMLAQGGDPIRLGMATSVGLWLTVVVLVVLARVQGVASMQTAVLLGALRGGAGAAAATAIVGGAAWALGGVDVLRHSAGLGLVLCGGTWGVIALAIASALDADVRHQVEQQAGRLWQRLRRGRTGSR